jgi:23S rRNA (pseudouridine1915-N3)-methyltransferase
MRWQILAIGKPKLSFAAAGIEEYAGRLKPFAASKLEYLKSGTRESESAVLLERSAGMFRIVMDERGEHLSSRALAGRISAWEQRSVKSVAVLIGAVPPTGSGR